MSQRLLRPARCRCTWETDGYQSKSSRRSFLSHQQRLNSPIDTLLQRAAPSQREVCNDGRPVGICERIQTWWGVKSGNGDEDQGDMSLIRWHLWVIEKRALGSSSSSRLISWWTTSWLSVYLHIINSSPFDDQQPMAEWQNGRMTRLDGMTAYPNKFLHLPPNLNTLIMLSTPLIFLSTNNPSNPKMSSLTHCFLTHVGPSSFPT